MLVLLGRHHPLAGRVVGAGLAAMWLWTGIGYHWLFFAEINRAAWMFGALFIVQALLIAHVAVVRNRLAFAPASGARAWLGWLFVAYAVALYPLIGLATGHAYPAMPTFGITPCPVVIFTFGLLLLASAPVPWSLLAIPFAWSLIGGSAALLLHVPQDWMLLLSGLASLPLLVRGRGRPTGR